MSPPSRAGKIQARIDQFLEDRGPPRADLEPFRDLLRLEGEEFVRQACTHVSDRQPHPADIQRLAKYLSMGTSREFLLWFIATSEPGRADGSNPAWLAVLTDDILHSLTASDLLHRSGQLFLELSYRRLFGRPGDAAGIAGWSALLEQGYRREFILWKLLHSEEAQARGNWPAGALALDLWTWNHANVIEILMMDEQDFLELAYRRLLGRRPDPAGAAHWADLARRGASKPFILWTMLRCPEALARQCPPQGVESLEAWAATQPTVAEILLADGALFLELCYRRVLGRAPDAQGLASWRDLMERGGSKEFVLGTLLRCPEAQARQSCLPREMDILDRWASVSLPKRHVLRSGWRQVKRGLRRGGQFLQALAARRTSPAERRSA
ncbi:MAG TPA: DUF4214 domain-containing protein [Gemmataceae bacterium]|nr:DUF4214 domain-containing protein [Gemmataceae bacterium]